MDHKLWIGFRNRNKINFKRNVTQIKENELFSEKSWFTSQFELK
jgi:hypothetical protein